MPKINANEFNEVIKKYGVDLRNSFSNSFLGFITGDKERTSYSFNYCGAIFSYNIASEFVVIENLPFEVAQAIYTRYPNNPYGICYNFTEKNKNDSVSPKMGVTDSLYEAKLEEIELYAPKDEWSKLIADAANDLMRRPIDNKYIKLTKVYTKDGLDVMMSELCKYVNTLDKWAYASNVRLPIVDLEFRNTIRDFDNVLGLETSKIDSRTGNSIEHSNKQNSFSSQVQYDVGNGRIMIVAHGYNKVRSIDSNLKGEFISVQMIENNELINEIIYNISDKECHRLRRKDYSYDVLPATKEDEQQIMYILRESILYADSIVNSDIKGRKK